MTTSLTPIAPDPGTPRTDNPGGGVALSSLITGIASVVLCGLGVVLGPVAVVLGFVARAKGSKGGMSLAGVITGFAGFLISVAAIGLVVGGVIFSNRVQDEISVDLDEIINRNFPDDEQTVDPPQQDFGSLPVDERLGFPIAEGYIEPAGFASAYDAWITKYSSDGAWDGRYDGDPVDTPCYTFDGAEFWTYDVTQEKQDACLVEYELWWETYSGVPEPVIKQFGFGGAGAGIEVEAVSRSFSDASFPGQDVAAMTEYLKANYFASDVYESIEVSSGELGGLPATIFEIQHANLDRYRTYAVFTPTVYSGSLGGESEFFLVTVWDEAEWVASSDEAVAHLESSFRWK